MKPILLIPVSCQIYFYLLDLSGFKNLKGLANKTNRQFIFDITLVLVLIILSSCQKEPTASFTVSSSIVNLGETVTFTNTSSDANSYFWDFGDGETSISTNPTHIYDAAGTYTVTLTAFSKNINKSDEAKEKITVGESPIADFTAGQTTITEGGTVSFTDLSTKNPTSWSWNFGDGGTSTLQNPSHEYSNAGIYNVSLTSTNAYGSNTETKNNYIIVGNVPIVDFTANQTTIAEGGTVNFTDLSTNDPTSWSWNFGDDETSSEQNPNHTYTSSGLYTVSLTASNNYGSDTRTRTNFITVSESGVEDGIIFNPNLTYGSVTDIDDNTYKTIQIGTQTWMAENLKTTKYNDNNSIPLVTDNSTWAGLSTPAYCWYNNDEASYKNPYGALYNWYAVETGNLCPVGWHVPSETEWTTLIDYLGGTSIAGGKLKETGTTHWNNPNTDATNESGFTALQSAERSSDGPFASFGLSGQWWSSTDYTATNAWHLLVYYNNSIVNSGSHNKKYGFSVRCIKD